MTYGLWSCNDFGTLSQATWAIPNSQDPAAGVTIIYGSTECAFTRLIKVNVYCDPTAVDAKVMSAQATDSCTYVMNINSVAGCPIRSDSKKDDEGGMAISVGWLLIILFIVCIILYLIAGSLYKWKIKGVSLGINLIPNIEFWKDLPFLVKDGVVFTYRKVFFCVGAVRGRYDAV